MNMMLLLVVIILQYSAYQTYLRPNDPLYRHIAISYQRPQPVYRSMEERYNIHPSLSTNIYGESVILFSSLKFKADKNR